MTRRSEKPHFLRLALVLWVAGGACDSRVPAGTRGVSGPVVASEASSGDTSVVYTRFGSVWGVPMTLQDELSVGLSDGPDEYLFGNITQFAIGPRGEVWIYDRASAEIRSFRPDGTFVRVISRAGDGPGENRDVRLLAANPAGGLLAIDGQLSRVQWWDADGTLEDERTHEALAGWVDGAAASMDRAARLLWARDESVDAIVPTSVLFVDLRTGVADTLALPGEVLPRTGGDYSPREHWAVGWDGRLIRARSDSYEIDVLGPEDRLIRFGRDVDPVAVLEAERERYITRSLPAPPRLKPAFRKIWPDRHGTVTVHVHTAAEEITNPTFDPSRETSAPTVWIEPPVIDVFRLDGTFMGQISLPLGPGFSGVRTEPPVQLVGDYLLWAVASDSVGIQRLTRYELVPDTAANR